MSRWIYLIAGIILVIYGLTHWERAHVLNHGLTYAQPDFSMWGGADSLGRDLLSRSLLGAVLSLIVVMGTAIVSLSISLLVALWVSFQTGPIKSFFNFVIDCLDSLPNALIAASICLVLKEIFKNDLSLFGNLVIVIISVSLSVWPPLARQMGLEILQIQTKDFINASRLLGAGSSEIGWSHYRPHLKSWMKITFFQSLPGYFMAETFLSYTGSSLNYTLGYLLFEGWKQAYNKPHLFFVPVLILLVIMGTLNTWFHPKIGCHSR